MRYLLIDTANMFFRARHGAHRASDAWTKLGFALHVTLASANRVSREFAPDHVVFALEGRSWRRDFYPPYKRNRSETRAAMTEEAQEEDRMFWEAYDHLTAYLRDHTNCSVIRHPEAEADDVIARWIDLHPQDEHIIVSSDTDFVQLVASNVKQFNGITDELISLDGVTDIRGKTVIDRKTKQAKKTADPEWLLFEKCMRGDASDNVFSAYPGVRTKGTRNKVGLQEAFADRAAKGYAWNNLMLQRWTDHTGQEHRVLDDYTRNRQLIDLRQQPAEIKAQVDQAIRQQISHKDVGQVGVRFMKFCGSYELTKCSEQATQFASWLNLTYQGTLDAAS